MKSTKWIRFELDLCFPSHLKYQMEISAVWARGCELWEKWKCLRRGNQTVHLFNLHRPPAGKVGWKPMSFAQNKRLHFNDIKIKMSLRKSTERKPSRNKRQSLWFLHLLKFFPIHSFSGKFNLMSGELSLLGKWEKFLHFSPARKTAQPVYISNCFTWMSMTNTTSE